MTVDSVLRAISLNDSSELESCYDNWAPTYDKDHLSFGLYLLVHFVGAFCKHVSLDTFPILDAGGGTGRLGEALKLHGYSSLTGLDFSKGMLEKAECKQVYDNLHHMRLGDSLDLPDNYFAVTASVGALTVGHAKADSFDELLRVTKAEGLLILSMRSGHEPETNFNCKRTELEQMGVWRLIDKVPEFISHPEFSPPNKHEIYVYRKNKEAES